MALASAGAASVGAASEAVARAYAEHSEAAASAPGGRRRRAAAGSEEGEGPPGPEEAVQAADSAEAAAADHETEAAAWGAVGRGVAIQCAAPSPNPTPTPTTSQPQPQPQPPTPTPTPVHTSHPCPNQLLRHPRADTHGDGALARHGARRRGLQRRAVRQRAARARGALPALRDRHPVRQSPRRAPMSPAPRTRQAPPPPPSHPAHARRACARPQPRGRCATVAFGLGIDNPNVRLVLIENYRAPARQKPQRPAPRPLPRLRGVCVGRARRAALDPIHPVLNGAQACCTSCCRRRAAPGATGWQPVSWWSSSRSARGRPGRCGSRRGRPSWSRGAASRVETRLGRAGAAAGRA